MPMIVLAVAWVAWCLLHSLLIAGPARRTAEQALGRVRYAYRLLYNGAALLTLVPVLLLTRSVDGPTIFNWWGWGLPIGAFLFTASGVFFLAGARAYDMDTFLGLAQLRDGRHPPGDGGRNRGGAGLEAGGGISRVGIMGVVRHPWYTAGILLLWVGPKSAAALVTAGVLTVYLIVGAFLEERRLEASFGEEYRRYRREVSMFLPIRWIRSRVGKA